MSSPPHEGGDGSLRFRYTEETEFWDEFEEIIPSAPIRRRFFERAIRHQLDRILEARATGRRHGRSVHLDGGFGLLITEAGLADIPECLVAFEYEVSLEAGSSVTFFRIRRAPALDEVEDYSDDS